VLKKRRNAVRQEQETEVNRAFDISGGELGERSIFALVTGIGIAVGARLLSFVSPVVTANRFDQVSRLVQAVSVQDTGTALITSNPNR